MCRFSSAAKYSKPSNCRAEDAWAAINCLQARSTTSTSRSLNVAAAERSGAESSVGSNPQSTENGALSVTEPISARFGRKETKAVQRPQVVAPPVSEVRSDLLNSFETQRNLGAEAARRRVRNRIMAGGGNWNPTVSEFCTDCLTLPCHSLQTLSRK